MLEAKGRKREPNAILKYAYILKWIDEILPEKTRCLCTKEKCWWILHGLDDFPKCHACGKTIGSQQFINITRGYRTYCCVKCAHMSNNYKKHLSDSQRNAFEKDPCYYKKKAKKNIETRLKKYGSYFSKESLSKRKDTIAQDPDFWKNASKRCKETKIENGHSPNWNNSKKASETRRKKNNGSWESWELKCHKRKTSLDKYGVDDPNRSSIVK